MPSGKLTSLTLVLLLTAVTVVAVAGVILVEPLASLPVTSRLLAVGGLTAATFLVLLLPGGAATDRALRRLDRYVDGSADEDEDDPAQPPRWSGPVPHAVGRAVDQFRRREAALRQQVRDLEIRHHVSAAERRQIEAVINSLRDGVLVTDAFNEIVMANETAAGVLGFAWPEAMHRSIDEVVADEQLRQLIRDTRDNANFSDRRHVEYEIRSGSGGGGTDGPPGRAFSMSLTCVPNHKQEVAGVIVVFNDLTREREVSQMKTDFVSKASHELRTPLSSIRAYVEMLVDGEAEDESSRREFYRIIQSETNRLSRLIDNMLNISRIEAGIVQIDRENVDLKGLIDRAVSSLEPQAREKSISLHRKIAPVDLSAEGDPDMLHQAILNLVSNAIKYTPEGGRVTVSADSDNLTRSIVVTVSDTGLGIPPDALPRLFDKFYRVENYKRVAKGTGLGLSLCKHIVETVHRGQIGVESTVGMGSRFWFSIPMQYAGSQAAA